MAEKLSTREQATLLAQRMNLTIDERTSALIDALCAAPSSLPLSISNTNRALPHTDSAIRVAIADTFVLDEIGAVPDEDLNAIVDHCDTVTIGGKRRLRLRKASRVQFLNEVSESSPYRRLLVEQVIADRIEFDTVGQDPIRCANAWLRCLLHGEYADLNRIPISELRAAVQALGQLDHVRLPHSIPDIEHARDLLELAELLEPLRTLIGAQGDWDGAQQSDRFVGRAKELRILRSHVDVLESQSFGESISRGFTKISRGATSLVSGRNPGVLMLKARGGMGKSSLLAKFILDHSRATDDHVPTIYLDFDSAALQPREPRNLFMEAIRQIRLQLPAIKGPLRALEQRIGDSLLTSASGSASPSATATVSVQDHGDWSQASVEFRHYLRSQIGHGGVILLVLDTMEVVQSIPDVLGKVVEFVNTLGTRGFPELRIVVAGRADVPELMVATEFRNHGEKFELEPLSIPDSTQMTLRLGHELVGDGWKRAWSNNIVGNSRSDPARREPLTLRLAVELIRSEPDDESRERRSLEISQQPVDASGTFVGALYRRRILAHVRDPEVRKLAWPGLVLRRITLPLAHEMLVIPCALDPQRLQETFDALAREVWIVAQEGEGPDRALRHLADLRSRTLPLMRSNDPALFGQINKAAIEYFGRHQASDVRARAEWVYHRLLAAESSLQVRKDWCEDMASLLSGAAEDFPAGSDAHNFLLARTARRRLPVPAILELRSDLALEHIARCWPDLGDMAEERLVPLLVSLSLGRYELDRLPPDMRNVLLALQVKSGHWPIDGTQLERTDTWHDAASEAYDYYTARALTPLFSPPPEVDNSYDLMHDARSRRRFARQLSNRLLQSIQVGSHSDYWHEQDLLLSKILPLLAQDREGQHYTASSFDTQLLRASASVGQDTLYPALRLVLMRDLSRPDRDRSYSLKEVRCLLQSENGSVLKRQLSNANRELFAQVETSDNNSTLRFSDRAWLLRIEDCLKELIMPSDTWNPSRRNILALRQYAAAKDGDWLIPIAYAAARATESRIPKTVVGLLRRQSPENSPRRWSSATKTGQSSPEDVLHALRSADEASNLVGVARLFADAAVNHEARDDLNYLLTCLTTRRIGVQAAILQTST